MTKDKVLQFQYKTADGRVLVPTIHIEYPCKKCGYVNKLVQLAGKGRQFINPKEAAPHNSMCHKCDDVEIITVEFDE